MLRTGTKSLLFGAHCFFLHPLFVARAWHKLYGFPLDPRLWVAFLVHDWGYFHMRKMDDARGEEHVYLGARIMHWLFDPSNRKRRERQLSYYESHYWYYFTLLHSRFIAKKLDMPPSKLCFADKLSMTLEPRWLYLLKVNLSGEVHEYMQCVKTKYKDAQLNAATQKDWYKSASDYMYKWVYDHKDGKVDHETKLQGV